MESFLDLMKRIEWKEVIAVISAIAFLITAVAVLMAVLRVNRIVEALREFRKSKQDLTDLLDAIDRLENVTPTLKLAASDLEEAVAEQAATVAEEQSATVAGVEQSATQAVAGTQPGATAVVDGRSRWLEISSVWREVRDQLEAIITEVDGRRKRSYNKMDRRNYVTIIEALRGDGKLTEAQATAAKQMNQRLLQLRPMNKAQLSENDLRQFQEWKTMFDQRGTTASSSDA